MHIHEKDAVEMVRIVKQFGSVLANDEVDFRARAGEIHALLGENGAGKSTMMCMLSGVYRPTSGDIWIHGEKVRIRSPKDAMKLGIGMVFQNFRLVQTLTAAENIVLGEAGSFWRGPSWLARKSEEIEAISKRFGLLFPVDRPIWQLSVGEQQRVEIVKTLYRGADFIILDEPTSVLTPGEVDQLFETLDRMKKEGKTVIMTTHKLKEVMFAADRISVMRKGKMIATLPKTATNERELAQLMMGSEKLQTPTRQRSSATGEPMLTVRGLDVYAEHGRKVLDGLHFQVGKGEIVGVAGVSGNGQKELVEVLTGLRAWKQGDVQFDGEALHNGSVRDAIQMGIGHVPESRMRSGLAGSLGSVDNLLFKTYRSRERSRFGLLRTGSNRSWSQRLIELFDVKTAGMDAPIQFMSGGNQQKLLFAREIDQGPKLMIAVHPTQGLDVGATEGVYQLLDDLRSKGRSVLLISEDLDEVLLLADRILVIYGGRIVGNIPREEATREHIGMLMAGSEEDAG
ncbi:ABC transporter ATP-binding protein [Paenibacillus roseipurpureus]|uniref:ABC transporter ATP-binding protein n=1 Tax=Paenibacillus roseopurpureus TaxID=2918901 RepID=A0AA96LR60_9BACL|nr:ABC transporter ATP-binding protein [Paenibacillus sp. MBLB1832]WNR45056.1 ABC transporter ATP-binding protein [Paenibacillus sp. MBLB1832]